LPDVDKDDLQIEANENAIRVAGTKTVNRAGTVVREDVVERHFVESAPILL
jgi:HSP20 family molecular chaperone IbpA